MDTNNLPGRTHGQTTRAQHEGKLNNPQGGTKTEVLGAQHQALPDSLPVLCVAGLCKQFFRVQVLHDVGFEVFAGKALGLVGENGSGKSTSMNILAGVHAPDAGSMQVAGLPYAPADPAAAMRAGVAIIHQELNLFPNLTIEENLFLTALPTTAWVPFIRRSHLRNQARALLDLVDLHVPGSRLVGSLSQGERQLVEIAKALHAQAKIIIFDEPTTSLTTPEVLRLFGIIERLKAQGTGLIYISHALADVRHVCEHVTVLRDGHVAGAGSIDEMPLQRMIRLMVGREIDSVFPIRAVPPGSAPDSAQGPAHGPAAAPTVTSKGTSTQTPETAARPPRSVALRVEGLSRSGVAANISFDIHESEVLGLCGLMGSGRSEIARMIFGLDAPEAGSVSVGTQRLSGKGPQDAIAAGIAFLTEDRRAEGLILAGTVASNVQLASLARFTNRAGLLAQAQADDAAGAMSRQVRLSTEAITTTLAKHLSGGNQQKVVLAKWLMRTPRVFILDEPTRGIDIGARQEIYRLINALVEAGSAVLLISSEIEELIGLSDRIITISRGELTGTFERSQFDREAMLARAMVPVAPHAERAATGGGPGAMMAQGAAAAASSAAPGAAASPAATAGAIKA